jgi:hypothetical protein
MSEEFEVRGPHDEVLEHPEHHEHVAHGALAPFANRIAVTTAILATIGAIFSYQSNSTEGLALLYKNEAAIRKTDASNHWGYYQAKGEKQNLAELGASLSASDPKARAKFAADVDKYMQQKEEIAVKARTLEKSVEEADKMSEDQLHQHHRWSQATTFIQISISLAAITLLTRRRWLQVATYGMAGLGTLVGVAALLGL